MTMKLTDAAPNEALLVEISDRLFAASSEADTATRGNPVLDLDSTYLEAARTMLETLSEQVAALRSETLSLTEQQVRTYLDFDPAFVEVAKDMLREFIARKQDMGDE